MVSEWNWSDSIVNRSIGSVARFEQQQKKNNTLNVGTSATHVIIWETNRIAGIMSLIIHMYSKVIRTHCIIWCVWLVIFFLFSSQFQHDLKLSFTDWLLRPTENLLRSVFGVFKRSSSTGTHKYITICFCIGSSAITYIVCWPSCLQH